MFPFKRWNVVTCCVYSLFPLPPCGQKNQLLQVLALCLVILWCFYSSKNCMQDYMYFYMAAFPEYVFQPLPKIGDIWGNHAGWEDNNNSNHGNCWQHTILILNSSPEVIFLNPQINFIILSLATLHRNYSGHSNFEPCSTKELVPCHLQSKFVCWI